MTIVLDLLSFYISTIVDHSLLFLRSIVRWRLVLNSPLALTFVLFVWMVHQNFVRVRWLNIYVVAVLLFRSRLPMLILRMARRNGIFGLWKTVCRLFWPTQACQPLFGAGQYRHLNTFVIDFPPLYFLPVSLRLRLTFVVNPTFHIFAYGGANVSSLFLRSCGPRWT